MADGLTAEIQLYAAAGYADPDRAKLRPEVFKTEESQVPFLAIPDTGLPGQVARWVRGFHAALYREFLPVETRWTAQLPFPSGRVEEDGYTIDKILPQHRPAGRSCPQWPLVTAGWSPTRRAFQTLNSPILSSRPCDFAGLLAAWSIDRGSGVGSRHSFKSSCRPYPKPGGACWKRS